MQVHLEVKQLIQGHRSRVNANWTSKAELTVNTNVDVFHTKI